MLFDLFKFLSKKTNRIQVKILMLFNCVTSNRLNSNENFDVTEFEQQTKNEAVLKCVTFKGEVTDYGVTWSSAAKRLSQYQVKH